MKVQGLSRNSPKLCRSRDARWKATPLVIINKAEAIVELMVEDRDGNSALVTMTPEEARALAEGLLTTAASSDTLAEGYAVVGTATR